MKKQKGFRVLGGVFLVIIFAFFAANVIRLFTRQVLVNRMGMNNAFVRLVFFDQPDMTNSQTEAATAEAATPAKASGTGEAEQAAQAVQTAKTAPTESPKPTEATALAKASQSSEAAQTAQASGTSETTQVAQTTKAEQEEEPTGQSGKTIHWAKKYPFQNGSAIPAACQAIIAGRKNNSADTQVQTWTLPVPFGEKINFLKDNLSYQTTEFLPGYETFVSYANGYKRLMQWNFTRLSDYNNIIRLENDYLVGLMEEYDQRERAYSTIDLKEYCDKSGIPFLYVMEPTKICISDEINGEMDHSNQNADAFLSLLAQNDVQFLDTRALLHRDGMDHHASFFRTDHHWKPETGLWAAQKTLEALKERFGLPVHAELLNAENFTAKVHEKLFLGSQGVKLTALLAKPEDISQLMPTYETHLRFRVPEDGLDRTGDFSITYNASCFKTKGSYNTTAYSAYLGGNHAFCVLDNLLLEEACSVLVIHHSYANSVVPFLALGVKNVLSLDLRTFTGSVRTFIEKHQPDAVVVMVTPEVHPIDWESHTDLFDFR